jgi:hypothetical protein
VGVADLGSIVHHKRSQGYPATRHRLRALLLVTLFVTGNFGLPATDILLEHSLGPHPASQVHLEPAGGCRNHAEHCVLSRLLNDLGQQSPSSAVAGTFTVAEAPRPRSADLWSAPPRTPTNHHSRAPPAPQP